MRFRTAEVISTVDSFLLRTASASSVARREAEIGFIHGVEFVARRKRDQAATAAASAAAAKPCSAASSASAIFSLVWAPQREDVVARMEVDAVAQRRAAEGVAPSEIGIVVEKYHRHLCRPVWRIVSPCRPARSASPSRNCCPRREIWPMTSSAGQHLQRGDGCGHRHGAAPEGARAENAGSGLAQPFRAGHGRERMAIGDRFAPGRQIRAHAERLPAAAVVEPEPGPHLVQNEGASLFTAQLADGVGKCLGRHLLVAAEIVAEGGDDYCRKIVSSAVAAAARRLSTSL